MLLLCSSSVSSVSSSVSSVSSSNSGIGGSGSSSSDCSSSNTHSAITKPSQYSTAVQSRSYTTRSVSCTAVLLATIGHFHKNLSSGFKHNFSQSQTDRRRDLTVSKLHFQIHHTTPAQCTTLFQIHHTTPAQCTTFFLKYLRYNIARNSVCCSQCAIHFARNEKKQRN